MAMHGGKRKGSGRKRWAETDKPTSNAQMELRAEINNRLRRKAYREADKIANALLSAGLGVSHFFKRLKDGRFERVTDEAEIERLLNNEQPGGYHIFTRDPNVGAINELLNRAVGKAKETVEMDVTLNAEEEMVEILRMRRKRWGYDEPKVDA